MQAIEVGVLAELGEKLRATLTVRYESYLFRASVSYDVLPQSGLVEFGHLVEGESEVVLELLGGASLQIYELVVPRVSVPP